MGVINKLESYADERGNEILYSGSIDKPVIVNFTGSGNRLIVAAGARIAHLNIQFDCDNALVEIGSHKGVGPLRLYARMGEDAVVKFGDNVSTTEKLSITAAEGSKITFGTNVMIAAQVEIRCDDAHPIFDVESGKRVNPAKDIVIGNHVWIAKRATIMGGVTVNDGSVIGLGSIVTKDVPNNCIVAGVPARVVRKNIAWERPHLSGAKPPYKPDSSTIKKSDGFWNMTDSDDVQVSEVLPLSMKQKVKSRISVVLRSIADRLD